MDFLEEPVQQMEHEEFKPNDRPTTSYQESSQNIGFSMGQKSSVVFAEELNVSNESMLRPSTSYNASKPGAEIPKRKIAPINKMSREQIMMQYNNAIN